MNRKIGAHVSASGGYDKAIDRAHDIGANCVQIFSASPRVWFKPSLAGIDPTKMFARQKELDISPVVTHALYLINLASENPTSVEKSIKALKFEMEFDAKIKGAGIVVHIGSHQGRGWEAVKEQLVKGITEILKDTPDNSTFLIENSAGQNGKLCSDLSEIKWLIDQVKSKRLKWCMDTCHAYCTGYALNPKNAAKHPTEGKMSTVPMSEGAIVLEDVIEKLDLWNKLAVVHVNDSRDPFGSGKDRHANLGDGSIPIADFEHFLNLKPLKDLPLILEVPGLDNEGPDAENIKRLKKMVE